MATKKTSLSAALHEASGNKRAEDTPTPEMNGSSPTTGRQGKKIISGHFDPAVSRQLKQLALDNNSTVQELLREALNDLFVKHSRKPIA
jgi:hypothetical protein